MARSFCRGASCRRRRAGIRCVRFCDFFVRFCVFVCVCLGCGAYDLLLLAALLLLAVVSLFRIINNCGARVDLLSGVVVDNSAQSNGEAQGQKGGGGRGTQRSACAPPAFAAIAVYTQKCIARRQGPEQRGWAWWQDRGPTLASRTLCAKQGSVRAGQACATRYACPRITRQLKHGGRCGWTAWRGVGERDRQRRGRLQLHTGPTEADVTAVQQRRRGAASCTYLIRPFSSSMRMRRRAREPLTFMRSDTTDVVMSL